LLNPLVHPLQGVPLDAVLARDDGSVPGYARRAEQKSGRRAVVAHGLDHSLDVRDIGRHTGPMTVTNKEAFLAVCEDQDPRLAIILQWLVTHDEERSRDPARDLILAISKRR